MNENTKFRVTLTRHQIGYLRASIYRDMLVAQKGIIDWNRASGDTPERYDRLERLEADLEINRALA